MEYTWLIPALPFTGFLINGLLGNRLSKKLVSWIACSVVGGSFVLALLVFAELLSLPPAQRVVEPSFYHWIQVGAFDARASFLIDPLSTVMVLIVTGVGFLIHIYSVGYMHDDPGFGRYFAYLNLFVAAMLILVLANNFLLMFVGWEGVGLCSYLLIGFWYEKDSASAAGKKAFIVNRIGDFGFLLAIFLIFVTFGTVNFQEVFAQAAAHFSSGNVVLVAATLLLFLGATGKSAQIPLYVWLPDAMEGPTPVSALIHAATMVTAGVYMVARCSVLYAMAPFSLGMVALIGCVTAFFAATIALVQNDIKRVLAYSTVSQLGYMFLGCGVGAFVAGIFHLMTHAFFKALLFLGSGSVIHALGGEQNIQNMGGLKKSLPVTHATFLAGTLAIAGIVPFAGFFSKDEILWETWLGGHSFLYLIALSGALLTAFYMFRLMFLTFHGTSRLKPETVQHVHEAPPSMKIPLILLAILSLVGGWIQIPFLEEGKILGEFLDPVFAKAQEILRSQHEAHFTHWLEGAFMGLSLGVAAAGIVIAYRFYIRDPRRPAAFAQRFASAYRVLFHKYYIDELYQKVVVTPLAGASDWLCRHVDAGIIDALVNATGRFFVRAGGKLRQVHTGLVHHYALSILLGASILFLYAVLK